MRNLIFILTLIFCSASYGQVITVDAINNKQKATPPTIRPSGTSYVDDKGDLYVSNGTSWIRKTVSTDSLTIQDKNSIGAIKKYRVLTKAKYDSILVKDPETIYYVKDSIIKGAIDTDSLITQSSGSLRGRIKNYSVLNKSDFRPLIKDAETMYFVKDSTVSIDKAKVQAGNNTTVTGTGSTVDPYVINATPIPTDLSYTASASNGVVSSSSGTNATIPLANATNSGLLSHYSEPSTTLNIVDEGGGATYTFNILTNKIVEIGNLVFFNIYINTINTTGTPSGELKLTGLPFSDGSVISNSLIRLNGATNAVEGNECSVIGSEIKFFDEGSVLYKSALSFSNGVIRASGVYKKL